MLRVGADAEGAAVTGAAVAAGAADAGAPNAARLLSFFTMSDIHLTDKESPAMLSYAGSSAGYGANVALETYYMPAGLATTQVLKYWLLAP